MKPTKYLLALALGSLMAVSCSDDDSLGTTIFPTDVPAVDTTLATAPFDKWLYDNFVLPYNVEVQYRFNLTASDLGFQLAPAEYDKSQLLAHLIRYLFYDVYTKYAGENFMKQYGPRIFHFIGSSGYNASTGTEVLGTAAGGVKITLYMINEMKAYTRGNPYDADDVDLLNEKYFHTMHHEFSHILHQTKSYPVTYGQVTPGTYDPMTWQERDSVTTHQLGYTTHYGSSATYEDFVELLSCIITDTDHRWMNRIINACAPGLHKEEKKKVMEFVDSLGIKIDQPNAPWNNFSIYEHTVTDESTKETTTYRTFIKSRQLVATFTSFRDFLDWAEKAENSNGNNPTKPGINALLQKVDIATKWYTENWGLKIYQLRKELRERQLKINEFLDSEVVIYPLKK